MNEQRPGFGRSRRRRPAGPTNAPPAPTSPPDASPAQPPAARAEFPSPRPDAGPIRRDAGRGQGRNDSRSQGRTPLRGVPDSRGRGRRGPDRGSRRGSDPGRGIDPLDPFGTAAANGVPGDSPAGAINRSRPIYGEPGDRGRGPWNRDRRNGGAPGGVPGKAGSGSGGKFRRGRRDGKGGPPGRGPGGPGAFDPRVTRGLVQRQRVEEEGPPPLPSNPREAALRILQAVDTRSAFSDRLLDGAHLRGGPDPRDHALLHELVKGTLRWRGRIDWILDSLIHIGLDQVQPWIKNVLRLGAYQVLFLDRIPPHAAVDEAVKLAHQYGHPGTAGLANSVLRRLIEEKDQLQVPAGDDVESLSVWGSHPRWIVERWLARFGPDATRALLTADNRIVPVGLRVNRLKITRDELIERLGKDGVTARAATHSPDVVWCENASAPGSLEAFKRGLCTAQDESEALVSRLVGPVPHERLLDLCAAPGGKCSHLAELMEDEGEVWAMERADGRVEALENAIARLGLHSIHVQQGDGRTYNFPMPFDRVLVDSPCSGLGVLARRADARWRKGPEVLAEMPGIQADLLAAGGRRLRPGGVLVYSVCSFEPEETTQIVDRFLRHNPAFVVESAAPFLPEAVVNADGFMEVLPHLHGCDGAFAARFRRT